MKLTRGGALTALALLIAIGCGGSDVAAVPGVPNTPADDDAGGGVEIVGPDGGGVDASLPDAPPPPDGKPHQGSVRLVLEGNRGSRWHEGPPG